MSEERYKNGKIYTIRYRGDDSLIYVGSTCLPLYKRWYKHKQGCFKENNKEYNKILYQKIRETDDFDNWYIELYEEYECENKEQLLKREGEIIRELGTLNKKIECRTKQEYVLNNKEEISRYQKQYYEQNRETLLESVKQYNKDNKQKIADRKKQHYNDNKQEILNIKKKYYEENREKILEAAREYSNDYKQKISEQRKLKIICECGCEVRKSDISKHKKTKKHLDLINSNL
jgi:hypothetical protein